MNTSKRNKNQVNKDKEVERLLETWDIVRCKYCGEEVSMLDANLIEGGQYFICKKHTLPEGE
jgi:hypothetical protein